MCRRFVSLTWDEAIEAIRFLETFSPVTVFAEWPVSPAGGSHEQAFPGAKAPVLLPDGGKVRGDASGAPLGACALHAAEMTWGYAAPWKDGGAGLVYNTRIESALGSARGMWSDSIRKRRCIVPTWGFYEFHDKERVRSPKSGRAVKRPYFFGSSPEPVSGAAAHLTLLAGIYEGERFSVVTCEPTPQAAQIHDRMPLVLDPREVRAWLGANYAALADRSGVRLSVEPRDFRPVPATASASRPLDGSRASGGQLSLF